MKQLLCVLLCLPMLATAQEKGIRFEEGLTWEQIKTKAKNENKMIFVDCYATWCGPCKVMDKNVYPDDTVGSYMNERFISVKIQMDITQSDPVHVKSLYSTARELQNKYTISALPTYLFFSSAGQIVHRSLGVFNSKGFIELAKEAINPDKQIYRLIEQWESGKLHIEEIPTLALKIKNEFDDKQLAQRIAINYKQQTNKFGDKELPTSETIIFFNSFIDIIQPEDKMFFYYYHYPNLIDSILKIKGYSENIVTYIIRKNIVDSSMKQAIVQNQEPNWKHLHKKIKEKYSLTIADQTIIPAKIILAKKIKDYKKYATYIVEQMDKESLENYIDETGAETLNVRAWDIFLYSTEKNELKKAINWVDRAIIINDKSLEFIDTKANLLYKLGFHKEAIALENKVTQLSKEFIPTLEKMKNGQATWETKK
jgi:thioredoxin-related protein